MARSREVTFAPTRMQQIFEPVLRSWRHSTLWLRRFALASCILEPASQPVVRALGHSAALAVVAYFALHSPALAFVAEGGTPVDAANTLKTVIKARVICSVTHSGNITHTKSCDDGYVCLPRDKCGPGPEMKRRMDAEICRLEELKATLDAEQKRLNAEQKKAEEEAARRRMLSPGGSPGPAPGTSTFPAGSSAPTSGSPHTSPTPSRMAEPSLPAPIRTPGPERRQREPVAPTHLAEPSLPPSRTTHPDDNGSKSVPASPTHMAEPSLPPPGTTHPQQGPKLQQATGPLPDVNSLRASQGTCSDITEVGSGPGPSNCNPSSGTNAQSQIKPTQSSSPQAGTNGNPGDAAMQATIQKLREAEATLRAAGNSAAAASAAEQAQALENAAQRHAASCPPLGPATYWLGLGTRYADYCKNANCFERGTAYYGLICFPKHRGSLSDEEWEKFCQEALAKLKPLAANYDKQWFADEMKRSDPSCDVDGSPLTLRKQLQRRQCEDRDYALAYPGRCHL